MLHYYIAEVISLQNKPYPFVLVELFGNRVYVKPLELEHIKFPKAGEKVLVLSLDYPLNSRLYYVNLDYDRTKNLQLETLESTHNKVSSILRSFPNVIQKNLKSYIIYNEDGEILLFCKGGAKIFVLSDSLILANSNRNYIKISNNSIDFIKNNSSYLYLKNNKVGLKFKDNKFFQIEDNSISLKMGDFILSLKNDKVYIGNNSNGIEIGPNGVLIYSNGMMFDPTNHTHTSSAPGAPTSPPTPIPGSPTPPIINPESTPSDYNS